MNAALAERNVVVEVIVFSSEVLPRPFAGDEVVVCNSVFQYFASLDQAEEAAEESVSGAQRDGVANAS